MKRYKVRYGSQIQIVERMDGTTVGDLKRDDTLRALLGYGDNVNAVYNGASLTDSALAPEFIDTPLTLGNPYAGAIVMETACNKKESN